MSHPNPRPFRSSISTALGFTIGELVLGSLLLAISAAWAWWRALPLWPYLAPNAANVALGLLAGVLACGILFSLMSPAARGIPGVAGLQDTLDLIRDTLGPIALWQIVVISGMAGLSEEVLFRGVVQQEFGLVAAALLFGLCHPLSVAYVVYAFLLGLFMGVVAELTGGVVAPIIVHAIYDVVGLWYLTRRWQPAGGAQGPESTAPRPALEDRKED